MNRPIIIHSSKQFILSFLLALIVLALNSCSHSANKGGDGKFNISHKDGKLLAVNFSFQNPDNYTPASFWYFDFISFSKGKLKTQDGLFLPPSAPKDAYACLAPGQTKNLFPRS